MGDQSNLGDIKNTASALMGKLTSQLPEWTGILNQDVDLVVLYERMGGLLLLLVVVVVVVVVVLLVLFVLKMLSWLFCLNKMRRFCCLFWRSVEC